jgi:hypothetical protein
LFSLDGLKTTLDDAHSWFLHELIFADELRLVLAQGIAASEPEDITIGEHVISGTRALEPRATSQIVVVTFARVVAWQRIDESFTALDDYDERDDTSFIQILSRSHYLDYVRAHHGWFEDRMPTAKLYRVWTENDVIDVVSPDAPRVEPRNAI